MFDKTALLVMVHGSPMAIANSDMYKVVDNVRSRALFGKVAVAFMECNEPTIPDAIAECAAEGIEKIVAVPYFLHVGTHVADDLPTLIEEARDKYPNVQFSMGGYIGSSPYITEILIQRASQL